MGDEIKNCIAHQDPMICNTGPDKFSRKSARTRNPGGLDWKTVSGRNESKVKFSINSLLFAANSKALSRWFS
jgi:hypothetical protein